MRQNLIEGKVHRNIQQTQKKIFIFANELQFYISNHNIVNQVISFLIFFQYILYNLLSSLPIAQADSNSIQIIDYFYLIFCGTLSNPYKENVVEVAIISSLISTLALLLSFSLSVYLLVTTEHHPSLVKIVAFFWYYFLPFITPSVLVSLSRSYNFINAEQDNFILLFFLIINLLMYSVILIVGLANSASAFHVKHIFSSFYPNQIIILTLLIAISHQLIGFVLYPFHILLIVVILFQLLGVIYFTIRSPYPSDWMTVALLTYLIFSLGESILRISINDPQTWLMFVVLGFSIILASILTFSSKRVLLYRLGFITHLFDFTKVSIGKSLETMDLQSLKTIQLRTIIKTNEKLPTNFLKIIFELLFSRWPKRFEDSLFLYSLNNRINLQSGKLIINKEELMKLNALKFSFWRNVWMSDFASLPKCASKIGYRKEVLKQSIIFHNSYDKRGKLEQNKNNNELKKVLKYIGPSHKSKSLFSFFHILSIIFFLVCGISQIYFSFLFKDSFGHFSRFKKIRFFLDYISVIQNDLWPTNNVTLDMYNSYFVNAQLQWNKIKGDHLFNLIDQTTNRTYYFIINEYLNSLVKYNATHNIHNYEILTKTDMINIFQDLFVNHKKLFDQTFPNFADKIYFIFYFILLLVFLIYLVSFFLTIYISSSADHRFFQQFQQFSKSRIKNKIKQKFNNLTNQIPIPNDNTDSLNQHFHYFNDTKEVIVPIPLRKFEWKTFMYLITSFLISFIIFFLNWCIAYSEFCLYESESIKLSEYTDMSGYLSLGFSYYSLTVFFRHLNFTIPDLSKANTNSDFYLNILYNYENSDFLTDIIPRSLLRFLSSTYYLMEFDASNEYFKKSIEQIFSNIDLIDRPLYQFDCYFYVRVILFILFTVYILFISFIFLYISRLFQLSSSDEKHILLDEFKKDITLYKSDFQTFQPADLPITLIISDSKMQITFATKYAQKRLHFVMSNNTNNQSHEQVKLTNIDFGHINSYEILEILYSICEIKDESSTSDNNNGISINEYSTNDNSNMYSFSENTSKKIYTTGLTDSYKIKKENGKLTIIKAFYKMENYLKVLNSVVFLDDIDEFDDKNAVSLNQIVNPAFKKGSLTTISFKTDQIALISLKLIGLNEFILENSSSTIQQYLFTILSKIDEISEFSRICIRNNSLFVISQNINFGSLNQFVTICSDYGKKVQHIVSVISQKYNTPVFCSVLFHRCESSLLQMNNVQCGQSDFNSPLLNFIDECHSHFLINAIGFVPRMKATQIQNMSKIMTITLKNGVNADIYIYI